MRPVDDARPSVVLPVTASVPPTTELPVVVRLVVEALASVVWPEIVSEATVVVASVDVPVTTKVLVVVAFAVVRLVKNAVTAEKAFVKKLVEVALVVDAFVAKKLVVVLFVVELFVL